LKKLKRNFGLPIYPQKIKGIAVMIGNTLLYNRD
jgi:hypothetical protein